MISQTHQQLAGFDLRGVKVPPRKVDQRHVVLVHGDSREPGNARFQHAHHLQQLLAKIELAAQDLLRNGARIERGKADVLEFAYERLLRFQHQRVVRV